ncbi:hypothetical protein ACFZA2_01885 [Microbacterium sp. NPDC007973]|uniref:hypothetical protein n=1 Tax=Microbacterium sp. NPDC007973 TaxID=3364182 RepID=UPI0036E9FA18
MSNAARKARKRAGIRFIHIPKTPTRAYGKLPRGFGLVTGAEIMAALVARGIV